MERRDHRSPARIQRASWTIAMVAVALVLIPQAAAQPPDGDHDTVKRAKSTGTPTLKLSTTEWNFGTKWSGEEAETTIVVTNVGDAVLRIAKVKGSCGCTAPKLTKSTVEPGESVEMSVSYDTHKRKPKVRQTVRLHSNDPENPVQTVIVRGEVRQLLEMKPGHAVNFGDLERDSREQQVIEIECRYTEPMQLRLEDEPAEFFEARLETVEEGRRYRLIVDTKPPLCDGVVKAVVSLQTGVEIQRELQVRITGLVQPRLSLVPPTVRLSPKTARPSQRMLRLSYHGDQPPRITNVGCDHPGIEVETLPPDDERAAGRRAASAVVFRVSLPPASELPKEGATITINTDDPEYGEFRVPVAVLDRGGARKPAGRVTAPDTKAGRAGAEPKQAPVGRRTP